MERGMNDLVPVNERMFPHHAYKQRHGTMTRHLNVLHIYLLICIVGKLETIIRSIN